MTPIRDEEDYPENVDVQDSECVSNGIVDYCNLNNNETDAPDHMPTSPFYAQTMKKYGDLHENVYKNVERMRAVIELIEGHFHVKFRNS
ncbi:650_t:CDS:2 [Paraglomus brasilianum]|uniref:650_t:CDS:1 n=1 Tax=Paraglomus brasilianum TaxID=144538 RepID=A0A9N9CVH0_9GLOM|nr:650_t:CDS:2 [Paraglomus brasilianum]